MESLHFIVPKNTFFGVHEKNWWDFFGKQRNEMKWVMGGRWRKVVGAFTFAISDLTFGVMWICIQPLIIGTILVIFNLLNSKF